MTPQCLAILALAICGKGDGASARILAPLPRQVIQREGFDPRNAHAHHPGGPALGFAAVAVSADWPGAATDGLHYRVVALKNALGPGCDWTPLACKRDAAGRLSATARVSGGGWYRLELRDSKGVTASLEPFGVGEVFLIAGQSYACGDNDELLRVEDGEGRVVWWDGVKRQWIVAHDPPPNNSTGGSIWPALGDHLLPLARVPIGFVNVAVGGTSSRQWLPGERLYQQAAATGKAVGRFRAVLWQQGESDVIERTTSETYRKNLMALRSGLAREWGFAPPWFLAKSTLHPTVYNNPEGEGRIRTAVDELVKLPGFKPGPDTDILDGGARGGIGTRRHFTGLGQRRAALLWFAVLWQDLQQQR